MDLFKLDNPVWYSLIETHQDFAIDYLQTKFYHPDYCPFGGFQDMAHLSKAIDDYAALANSFFVVGQEPIYSSNITLQNNLVCRQMLLCEKVDIAITEKVVELQSNANLVHLHQLVNLVQPGYFKNKTPQLGRYFGIYKTGQLVAVTGERMQMNAFTEVSAVVTHPAHTRKGYAQQLVAYTCGKILERGKTPYLHVAANNTKAISLYQKLGFDTRCLISFWQLEYRL